MELKGIGLTTIAAMLLVSSARCSSDEGGQGGTGGASTAAGGTAANGGGAAGNGGATSSPFAVDSQGICQTIVTLDCPNDQASACVDVWTEKGDFAAESGCGTPMKALFACLATRAETDFICDTSSGSAVSRPGVCASEQTALDDCNG